MMKLFFKIMSSNSAGKTSPFEGGYRGMLKLLKPFYESALKTRFPFRVTLNHAEGRTCLPAGLFQDLLI